MTNLIDQTVSAGLPALLVHCAMHIWWDTFKKGKPIPGNTLGKARANKRLLEQWQQDHPDSSLPAWGDFIGIASTKHGPKKPITLVPVADAPLHRRLRREGACWFNVVRPPVERPPQPAPRGVSGSLAA